MVGNLKNATVALDALSVWYAASKSHLAYNKSVVFFFFLSSLKLVIWLLHVLINLVAGAYHFQHGHKRVGDDDSSGLLCCNRVLIEVSCIEFS